MVTDRRLSPTTQEALKQELRRKKVEYAEIRRQVELIQQLLGEDTPLNGDARDRPEADRLLGARARVAAEAGSPYAGLRDAIRQALKESRDGLSRRESISAMLKLGYPAEVPGANTKLSSRVSNELYMLTRGKDSEFERAEGGRYCFRGPRQEGRADTTEEPGGRQ